MVGAEGNIPDIIWKQQIKSGRKVIVEVGVEVEESKRGINDNGQNTIKWTIKIKNEGGRETRYKVLGSWWLWSYHTTLKPSTQIFTLKRNTFSSCLSHYSFKFLCYSIHTNILVV